MSMQKLTFFQRLWQNLKNLTTRKTSLELNSPLYGVSQSNEFIVVGLGRFGTSLAMTLNAYDHEVLAIDSDLKRVQQLSHLLPHVIQLDVTDIEALHEVGADSFDTGVVCIGSNLEANLLATVNLRKLGVRRVISKVRTTTQQDILLKVGADEVVLPEHEAGVRLGRKLAAVDFVDFMDLSHDTGVVEIIAPPKFIGASLRDTQIGKQYGLTVVAIRRNEEVIISPRAEEMIQERDILVVLGQTAACQKLRAQASKL
jgi:trk system potassium uptake protein TrkA